MVEIIEIPLQANYNFGIKGSQQEIPFTNILKVLQMIHENSIKTSNREGSGFHKGLSRVLVTLWFESNIAYKC